MDLRRRALPAGCLPGWKCSRSGRFFFSSRRRHTRSVSAFLLYRSSDLTKLREGGEEEGMCHVRQLVYGGCYVCRMENVGRLLPVREGDEEKIKKRIVPY